MNCKDCCNFDYSVDEKGWFTFIKCKLDNVCHNWYGTDAEKCENYNKDLSNNNICLNCKYYLGGGDWGLSCGKDYYKLVNALDKSCDKMERR